MNGNAWYPHYVGDYLRDTAHLSMQEDGAYRRLLDHIYSTAHPLPASKEALYRITRAFSEAERAAVDSVLIGFFELYEDGYHNPRADMELAKRAEHHQRLSSAGKKRWHKPGLSQAIASPHPHPQPQPRPQEEKNPAAKTAPPADLRHKVVVDLCFEAYRAHYGVAPTWGSREGNALKRFLMEHASIPAEEITRRYKNFLNTRERYHAEKHGSLCHLLGNFDTFADGPVPERINGNAKPRVSADQRTRDNLRAAGLLN